MPFVPYGCQPTRQVPNPALSRDHAGFGAESSRIKSRAVKRLAGVPAGQNEEVKEPRRPSSTESPLFLSIDPHIETLKASPGLTVNFNSPLKAAMRRLRLKILREARWLLGRSSECLIQVSGQIEDILKPDR